MKKISIFFALTALVSCNNLGTPNAGIIDTKANLACSDAKMNESIAREKWVDAVSTPGDMHKFLASMSGTWHIEGVFQLNEHSPAIKSTGICENKMILDGRYLQSTATTKISDTDSPRIVMEIIGYDMNKTILQSNEESNQTTAMAYYEGHRVGNTLALKGHYDDYAGRTEFRKVYHFIDSTHIRLTCYGKQPGQNEWKFYDVTMTKE